MNHGKTNIDNKIDQINAKIAKLLGKKSNINKLNLSDDQFESNITSNIGDIVYIMITIICILFLWFSTGIYYIGSGSYGVIVVNGKITEQVSGTKFSITYPYPFASVNILSADASEMNSIGEIDSPENGYYSLTKDLTPIHVFAQFSYKIANPLKLYNTLFINSDNIENIVRWNLQTVFHNYIASKTYLELHTANLTLIGNNIKNTANQELSKYGLELVKFNISKLQENLIKDDLSISTTITDTKIKDFNTNTESIREVSRDVDRNRYELR